MDDGKLDYFIIQTNRRLEDIEEKLDNLIEFQVSMKANSKTAAFMISLTVSVIIALVPFLIKNSP